MSRSIKTSGRKNEKMYSVTHTPWTIQVRGQQARIRTSCRSRIPREPRRKEPLAARAGALVIALIVIRRTPSLVVALGADICRSLLGNRHRGGCRDKHLCCGRIWWEGRMGHSPSRGSAGPPYSWLSLFFFTEHLDNLVGFKRVRQMC